MTELFVNFPQIYCSKHPRYQLNMLCRHPQCKQRGAICCRCQLKFHCDEGHTFDSFVPLDDVFVLCQNQGPKAEYFDDLSLDGIFEIDNLQNTLSKVGDSIKFQLTQELLQLGEYQKPFKDIFGVLSHYQRIDGDNTRTDDGNEGGLKSDFLNLMSKIADKIHLINGDFTIDQSDMNNCLTEIIERKQKNLNIVKNICSNASQELKIIELLFRTGCSYGINNNLQISQFNQWHLVYQSQYYELLTYKELVNLSIPKESLLMIGILYQNNILFCAIDQYNAIFEGKFNKNSQLNWIFNENYFGCECLKWNLSHSVEDIETKDYLFNLNKFKVIYYLKL